MAQALLKTDIPAFPVRRGKVRDVYDVGEDQLVIITTDRISAFDHVLPSGIPDRGRVLTQMTEHWCDFLEIQTHLLQTDISKMPDAFRAHEEAFVGRIMLVEKAKPFPVECVVRGYLCGSAWASYKRSGSVCGIKLPAGLQENSPLPRPLFTPTTKSDVKDEEITFEEMVKIVGRETAEQLERLSIECYADAANHAWQTGLIIADTKFEWGKVYGEIVLIDEVLTPDSSRFWPLDQYGLNKSMPSYDKQFVRDYLTQTGWDKKGEAPALSEEVIAKTRDKYLEAHGRIVGRPVVGLQK